MKTKSALLFVFVCFFISAQSSEVKTNLNREGEKLSVKSSILKSYLVFKTCISHFSAFPSDGLNIGQTGKASERRTKFSSKNNSTAAELIGSEVYVVDQEVTSETKTWAYTVDKQGNYQIGYAWIWVQGDDKEVDLQVKVGNTVIKKLTATSEIAPYRFETRLEGLTAGQQVTVIATPKNGASYRLNYHLAYATPNFESVGDFSVASYGAVGDGVTNDYVAIKTALNAVKSAGGGVLTFDGSKTYYVEGPVNYALFDFLNSSNIKAEGNGAKIILHPNGNFIRMDNSENIQIDGFTTTYSPLPYFQGKILDINIDALYLDMQVDDRYNAPETGKYISTQDKFGRSYWNTVPGTKVGDGRHLGIDSTAQIGNDNHKLRVFFKDYETADLLESKNQNATYFIAPDKKYGHALPFRDAYYCSILRSSRVKISNVLTHSICNMGYYIGSNYGPVTFSNTDILAPNVDDMHVSWRDGWHVWGNRYGIMIEDGDFDAGYMYDDVFSPHTVVSIVDNVSGNTIRFKSKPGESADKYTDSRLWLVGDLVSFWNEGQTVYYGMSRITKVAQVSPSQVNITLDSTLGNVSINAYAINEEDLNRDMVIRNSTTTQKGRITAVRQRTPILYQNCDFKNIHFWIYSGEPWRTRPRNIVFDNCVIDERQTFNVDDTWNLTFKNSTITGILDVDNSPNLIMDNSIASSIKLRNTTTAYVFGNSNGGTQNYDKDGSSIVYPSKPNIYPSYRPPFLINKAQDLIMAREPFDIEATSLTNSGSGYGWSGNWTSPNAGLDIKNGVSLKYIEGIDLDTLGGRILETSANMSNNRSLASAISLTSGTFYLSFLAKKNSAGAFRIETSNSSGQVRFGVGVTGAGALSARSGASVTTGVAGIFQNNLTYFVVVKFSNSGGGTAAVTRIKLYKEGDVIPSDDDFSVHWDLETSPNSTGVSQDILSIVSESGSVELDELILGSSFKSVTSFIDSAGTLSGAQEINIGGTTSFSSTTSGGTWSSGNPAVATVNVSTGRIIGVSLGDAIITYTIAGVGGSPDTESKRSVTVKDSGLPITISSFTATASNDFVSLKWQTNSENNTSNFNIYRSTDGINFQEVTVLKAAGTSKATLNYEAKDNFYPKGYPVVYYKLETTDLNGKISYSKVIAINLNFQKNSFRLYPNPSKDKIILAYSSSTGGIVRFEIMNINGKIVNLQNKTVRSGYNQIELNTSQLANGTYLIRWENSVEKFIKL